MKHRYDVRQARVFLDGPSALQLYRGRADIMSRARQDESFEDDYSSIDLSKDWISDEDVAATLAEENVLGHKAFKQDTTLGSTDKECDPNVLLPLRRSRVRVLNGCTTRSRDIKRMPFTNMGLLPHSQTSPLFLLAAKANDRRQVKDVKMRVLSKTLPAWSLMRAGKTVFVPTPELTFLLLAQHISLRELIAVGMEMCGHYRLQGASTLSPLRSQRTLYNQQPLTTPTAIERLLERSRGIPGVKTACRALKYVVPNSASPMETTLYMLLCLPRALGGYALPCPILNARRPVTKQAESFTFWKTLVPDLYWPSVHLDLEYDSESFHADPESLAAGARRTLALRAMKVDVLVATKEVVYDADAFDAMVRLLAKALHHRVLASTIAFEQQRRVLRDELLG